MKRSDDVFLLTLVDLLLQLLFLGLVLYSIAGAEAEARPKISDRALHSLDSLGQAEGVSDLDSLTDALTRLGPVSSARDAVAIVRDHGGVDSVKTKLVRLWEKEQGTGLPPCLFVVTPDGRREPVAIATITGWDDGVMVRPVGDTLRSLLRARGAELPSTVKLTFEEFTRAFRLLAPGTCRFRVTFVEMTDMVFARIAVGNIFSLAIDRSRRRGE